MASNATQSTDQNMLPKVLVFFLLCLFFFVSFRPIFSNDIWLHLKVGELIADSPFNLPKADPFSYTTSGRPWILHEWLSQFLFFKTYQFAGFTGLRLLRSVVETLTIALFFCAAYGQTRRYFLSLGTLLVVAYLLRTRFHIRPEIFSHLFMALFFLTYFTTRKHKTWLLLPISLGFVAWVNMHSFMVIVIAILLVGLISRGLVWIGPLQNYFAKPSGSKFKAAMLVSAVLAVFLTPYASKTFDYVFAGSQVARDYIMEWQPIFISLQREPFVTLRGAISFPLFLKVVVLSIVIVFLGGLLLSLLWKKSPKWPMDWALVGLMMSGLALSAIRFVWLLTIPLILTAHYIAMVLDTADRAGKRHALPKIIAWVLFWAGIAFWINAGRTAIPLNMHQMIDNDRYPTSIADILAQVHLQGHMFNPYGWGGYLAFYLYPDYKVFLDGRTVLHGPDLLRDHYTILHENPGHQRLIAEKYQFDFMILPKQYGMMSTCSANSWILVFENYNSSLYLRRDQANLSNLHRLADYYKINGIPFDIEKGFDVSLATRSNPQWALRYGMR
jgi:hypothetical protein